MYSYDELPYEDIAYYHTHPSNLAVIAALCGLNPPQVATCRVLELGCGSGYNLQAMAYSLPNATLVGIDLSARQIEVGQALTKSLNIERLSLIAGDVAKLDPGLGEFDYIIAHGLFSWVPAETRQAILALCKRRLSRNGIAFISYNTYPGWHMRDVLRDALRFHTPPDTSLRDKAQQAREAVKQMIDILPDQVGPYVRVLRAEMESIRDTPDNYIVHEFLEDNNTPFYFEEFAQLASDHGLCYLAEASFELNSFALNPAQQQELAKAKGGLIRREQYLDLLRNRPFRRSLLCHATANPRWSPSMQTFGEFRVQCKVEYLGVTEDEGQEAERFRLNGHKTIVTTTPILRKLLHCLCRACPRLLTCNEIIATLSSEVSASDLAPGSPADRQIAQTILFGYTDGLWLLLAYDPPYSATPGPLPKACPLARHRAAKGNTTVTNRLHRPVELTEKQQAFLQQVDGQTPPSSLNDEASLQFLADAALLIP